MRHWTKEEVEFLKANYSLQKASSLARTVGRTVSALHKKASKLKLLGFQKRGLNEPFICKDCGGKLNSKNWSECDKRKSYYICRVCHNAYRAIKSRESRKKNPLKWKVHHLKHSYPNSTLVEKELVVLWKLQKGRCNICKDELNIHSFHVDHIEAFSLGGKTEIENIQFLCEKCNRGKFTWTTQGYIKHCKKVTENN